MDSAKWVLGEDYTAAPTCATCHMSAVRTGDDNAFLGEIHTRTIPTSSLLAGNAQSQRKRREGGAIR